MNEHKRIICSHYNILFTLEIKLIAYQKREKKKCCFRVSLCSDIRRQKRWWWCCRQSENNAKAHKKYVVKHVEFRFSPTTESLLLIESHFLNSKKSFVYCFPSLFFLLYIHVFPCSYVFLSFYIFIAFFCYFIQSVRSAPTCSRRRCRVLFSVNTQRNCVKVNNYRRHFPKVAITFFSLSLSPFLPLIRFSPNFFDASRSLRLMARGRAFIEKFLSFLLFLLLHNLERDLRDICFDLEFIFLTLFVYVLFQVVLEHWHRIVFSYQRSSFSFAWSSVGYRSSHSRGCRHLQVFGLESWRWGQRWIKIVNQCTASSWYCAERVECSHGRDSWISLRNHK